MCCYNRLSELKRIGVNLNDFLAKSVPLLHDRDFWQEAVDDFVEANFENNSSIEVDIVEAVQRQYPLSHKLTKSLMIDPYVEELVIRGVLVELEFKGDLFHIYLDRLELFLDNMFA